nr:hypothetical protein [Tanacetum cinerariifolium]
MRIEQYFLMTDYSLWEVIINGDSPVPTRIVEGILQSAAPTTAEQKLTRKNKLKARGTTTQNLSFVSSSNTDSNTDLVSAAVSVSAVYAKMHVSSLPNVDSLSNATSKNLGANGPTSMGFDMSKVECYNCDMDILQESVGLPRIQEEIVLLSHREGLSHYQAEEEPVNYALMAFSSLRSSFDNELSPTKPEQALSHTHRPTTPIIEDWVSDSEDEFETKAPQLVPSFVQFSEQVKSPRNFVQHVTKTIPATTLKPASPKSANSGKRRNRKACFVCKSLDHLIKDCDYHAKKMAQPTPKNHAHRGFAGKMRMETKMPNSRPSFSYHKCINDPKKGNPQHALKDKGVIDSGCS